MKTPILQTTRLLRARATSMKFHCRKCAALAALALQITAIGAEPIVQWVTVAGSPGYERASGIALGPAGEIYWRARSREPTRGRNSALQI